MTYYMGYWFICQKFKNINANDWLLKLKNGIGGGETHSELLSGLSFLFCVIIIF